MRHHGQAAPGLKPSAAGQVAHRATLRANKRSAAAQSRAARQGRAQRAAKRRPLRDRAAELPAPGQPFQRFNVPASAIPIPTRNGIRVPKSSRGRSTACAARNPSAIVPRSGLGVRPCSEAGTAWSSLGRSCGGRSRLRRTWLSSRRYRGTIGLNRGCARATSAAHPRWVAVAAAQTRSLPTARVSRDACASAGCLLAAPA